MIGIKWLEVYIPNTKLDQVDLATHNKVDPNKYLIGLGQTTMSTCNDTEDIVSMHMTVCSKVLRRYPTQKFGFLGVGTETIMDKSKSIKSQLLPLFKSNVPHAGLDTYNACYGGTASMLHAAAWLQSDQWDPEAPLALVLCGDVASYQHAHEIPTGGCGVVAMVLSKDPIVRLYLDTLVHDMRDKWDFYKPHRTKEYPVVDGKLSMQCYLDAVINTYTQFKDKSKLSDFMLFHHPYNKLVFKGFKAIQHIEGITDEDTIKEKFNTIVGPACYLSKVVGNIYTGSLYLSLASLAYCCTQEALMGKTVQMFSYGSGYMASMFRLQFVSKCPMVDKADISSMLANQTTISVQQYLTDSLARNRMFCAMDGQPIGTYGPLVDTPVNDGHNHYCLIKVEKGQRQYGLRSEIADESRTNHHDAKMIQRIALHNTKLPFADYPWDQCHGRSCENIIGYTTVPTGLCGPAIIGGAEFWIPLATTEGALVASVNRGCKLLRAGTVDMQVLHPGMTRAPLLEFASMQDCMAFQTWSMMHLNNCIEEHVPNISRHLVFNSVEVKPFGRKCYIRMACSTGDAMGMNMITKLCDAVSADICQRYPGCRVASVSSNYCTDKKNSAVNWVNGRGRSVNMHCRLPLASVEAILHVDPRTLVQTHVDKNLIGSALAGAIGGHNAHAVNMVAALYLATGQDIAQAGTSASCILDYRVVDECLEVSLRMPSIECATVGGGTHLPTQEECRRIGNITNANDMACLTAYAVLAGELSLLGSLACNDHMAAHKRLNQFKPSA